MYIQTPKFVCVPFTYYHQVNLGEGVEKGEGGVLETIFRDRHVEKWSTWVKYSHVISMAEGGSHIH